MEQVAIAELAPELPSLETKQFRAVVTLIWPYSSSARQFALLLGDPDFRRRRRNGQVRARFEGSSAKAIARTGVGIGDEVVLALRGAQFVHDSSISTPGKSIDWELSYSQTLVARIIRDGCEMASLDMDSVAPTPATRSPARRQLPSTLDSPQTWHSPAFIKRTRLSDGPIFEAGYDPFNDDAEDRHDRKRRRKSYRDWNAWTYSARTPSPEKGYEEMEHSDAVASPVQPAQLPVTPLSPSKPAGEPAASPRLVPKEVREIPHEGEHADPDIVQNEVAGYQEHRSELQEEDFVRDADYYDLYAGPDEFPPQEHEIIQSDTESNTTEETSSSVVQAAVQVSVIDSDEEHYNGDGSQPSDSEVVEILSDSGASEAAEESVGSRERFSFIEVDEADSVNGYTTTLDHEQRTQDRCDDADAQVDLEEVPMIVMPPPPVLPLLQTNFQSTFTPGMLTPIGKEPSSPNLLPLDSATLPMPSPFPGGQGENALSYLEHVASSQQEEVSSQTHQQETNDDEFVVESSFHSSVSAYNASNSHATHESAFTDVRFTFGMDGSAFSRPAASSQIENGNTNMMPTASSNKEEPNAEGEEAPVPEEDAGSDTHEPPMTTEAPLRLDSVPLHEADEVLISLVSSPRDVEDEKQKAHRLLEQQDEFIDSHGSYNDVGVPDTEVNADTLASEQSGKEDLDHSRSEPIRAESPTVIAMASRVRVSDKSFLENDKQTMAATEVIDLGSASEEESEAEEPDEVQMIFTPPDAFESTQLDDAYQPDMYDLNISNTNLEDHDHGLISVSYPQLHEAEDEASAQHVGADTNVGKLIESEPGVRDYHEAQIAMDDGTVSIDDVPTHVSVSSGEPADKGDHPDIKVESIENDAPAWVGHRESPELETLQSEAGPAAELTIAVPSEGHRIGEMELVSVPVTGPARNTRSKTKLSMSPSKEDTPGPKRSSRSQRHKSPAVSVARTTLSPSGARSMSTVSPIKEATVSSPYNLRSQSKNLSPTDSATPVPKLKHTRNRSTRLGSADLSSPSKDMVSERGSSLPPESLDLPNLSFGPSQELGVSRGRFANVAFVKDSEESSLRSENSLSTVQYSDDWNMGSQAYITLSDSARPHDQDRDPPRSSPHSKGRFSSMTPTKPKTSPRQRRDPHVVIPVQSSPTRPAESTSAVPFQSSPGREPRSSTPIRAMSRSPRMLSQLEEEAHIAHGADVTDEHSLQHEISDSDYPVLPAKRHENELNDLDSAAPNPNPISTVSADDRLPSSPPAPRSKFTSTHHQSAISHNGPMTPDASQQTFAASQASQPAYHQGPSMPMTPQLTQTTTFEPPSFQADVEMEDAASKQPIDVPPATQSTPQRNATATNILSAPASPTARSAATSPSPDDAPKPELPSIGLSTPISYYTPLKDLPFFLNRSSHFHSPSSCPDILALVTSSSTPPKRAPSGPKDHTTTLHVTDLSTHPASTTVQIFRPYVTALPVADRGDVILLRAFTVRSLNRRPMLVSGEESAWCVWRYGKLLWGKKRGAFGEVREREEVRGPAVERGEGEWAEVEKLRAWWAATVREVVEERERSGVRTRAMDKELELSQAEGRDEIDGEGVEGDEEAV